MLLFFQTSAVYIQVLSILLGVEGIKKVAILRCQNSIILTLVQLARIPFTFNMPVHLAHFLLGY
jgi:hypothetical protein